jgi:hypothetical protein
LDKIKAPKTPTDPVLIAMAEKLRTPAGQARYRRRACSAEPVFGILKSALGLPGASAPALRAACGRLSRSARLRQFMLRGLKKVAANGTSCAWPTTSNGCTPCSRRCRPPERDEPGPIRSSKKRAPPPVRGLNVSATATPPDPPPPQCSRNPTRKTTNSVRQAPKRRAADSGGNPPIKTPL